VLFTSDFREYTEIIVSLCQTPKNPKFGSMLTLKFPSHAADILGGDGDGGGHGLLKGDDRWGKWCDTKDESMFVLYEVNGKEDKGGGEWDG
jgi:hypothetical protein